MEALMDIAIDASFLFSYTNSAKLREYRNKKKSSRSLFEYW